MSRPSPSTACDNCGDDLTYTSYEREWYLALSTEAKLHKGGPVYSTACVRPLDAEAHFCDLKCLRDWLAR